jgi:hypothetical protein
MNRHRYQARDWRDHAIDYVWLAVLAALAALSLLPS